MSDENIRLVHASGECEIDLARRELGILGCPVPVGGRAFEIIEVLARSAGELVTKDELMSRIWPGAIVTENSLQVHAAAIRKALGPNRSLLKTESGRGYRLVGDWIVRHHGAAKPAVGLQRMRADDEPPVTNFPASVTDLIGRTTAVARLWDLMSAYRVVTLTGPGGIGKTSLALKVARGALGEFADGGWLVELASLSDPAFVPAAVAHALRLPIMPENVTPESVARAIGDKTLLLILDNCEHVIEAAAILAETILALCAHTTIVATSREILRIQGEYVYRVPPLEVPSSERYEPEHILSSSAVELFIARIRALDAGFSPRVSELPNVGAICRHLDGIPLAIEFAAAQAATLGTQQVADGLHDRFTLLTHGRRTALPRQRTLRGVLDWSYELLSRVEQHLLRHLAIFAGGFTIDAAAAVVNDDGVDRNNVIEGVANLVAKSLLALDRATPSRWYLLDTIRAYALEKLTEHGERARAERRHALYFRALFPRLPQSAVGSISGGDSSTRLREIDNVRAALDWCFSASGDKTLGVDLTTGYGMWLQTNVGIFLFDVTSGVRQSPDFLKRALDAAEALDDLEAQAWALQLLISQHSFRAARGKAVKTAERLLRVTDRIGAAALSRTAAMLMGTALVLLGQPRRAQEFLEPHPNSAHSNRDRDERAELAVEQLATRRTFLSLALWTRGFIDQAWREIQANLDGLRGTEHPSELFCVLCYGVCRIVPTTGDRVAAEQTNLRLAEVATRIDAPFWQTAGRFGSGKLLIDLGEFEQGVAELQDALGSCQRTGWPLAYPEFKGALATGLAGLGRVDEALATVNEGLADGAYGEHGHDLFFAELLRIKGEILLRRGDATEAADSFHQAIDIARGQEALLWELRAAIALARLRVTQGHRNGARQFVAQVYDRFTESFDTPDLRAARAFLEELGP